MCFSAPNALAHTIAVVKSSSIKPYEDVFRGYKAVLNSDFREFVITDENASMVLRSIREIKTDLIFAIGLNALARVKSIRDIPIVYAMVSSPQSVLSDENNITGVSMNISAEKQLAELLKILPRAERVGMVYDPHKTLHLFDEVQDAVVRKGLSVISRVINNPRDAPTAIKDIMERIDAFWLLPDTTVISKETLKYLFLASIEKKVPVLAFSDKYIDMGALLALNIDAEDIGRQAGEMSAKVLSGKGIMKTSAESPRKAVVSVNHKAAKKLGINVN